MKRRKTRKEEAELWARPLSVSDVWRDYPSLALIVARSVAG